MKKLTLIVSLSAIACSAQFVSAENKTAIRFGHFPNITHAQGVIAHALLSGALLDRVALDPWSLLTATREEIDAISAAVEDAIAARARSVGAREGET